MKNFEKYKKGYFMPPVCEMKWAKKESPDKAPLWCSVDLRDGNQALVVPMGLEDKIEFFKYLLKLGFKEIEVGFPAASETEYLFLRRLIEDGLIPDDVTIQVLTQAREHIIKKTFEALKGAKSAIVHLYNSTSVAQREQVFRKSKEEIKRLATDGAKMLKRLADETDGNFRFEYSPESFTGTEPEYALEVCNAVLDIWKPTPDKKVIINLPVTVEMSLPHVYASQVEYMNDNLKYRNSVEISLHPHNDRGCGVADTELGLLAGADRVEGTLFGNGERTGNVDIITVAMNMFVHGIDPKLDFSNMPEIVETYERLTGMTVDPRHPYSGSLVFAAFSGSHQDAIAKGMKWREENNDKYWTVPYLPIDPKDLGRQYDGDVIRINSQSGKGGIGFLMEQKFGYSLPKEMREDFGYCVKGVSDHKHKELQPEEIYEIFRNEYVNIENPIQLAECHFEQKNGITAHVTISESGKEYELTACGNGRLDAVYEALGEILPKDYSIAKYSEHAIEKGSSSRACAYIGLSNLNGDLVWGVGIDNDIIVASIKALLSAANRVSVK